MSRIGKHPVVVPDGVELVVEGQRVRARGRLGELAARLPPEVSATVADGQVVVEPHDKTAERSRAMWGLSRTLVANLVTGVSAGFTRKLEISGVGYRASTDGRLLNLQLGYSHDIKYAVPEDIKIVCDTPTAITISGPDRQKVGQIAAEIRRFRSPEPYKGKGIKYAEETIRRKEGKKK